MKYNFKSIALYATAVLSISVFSACNNQIENIEEQQNETKTITFTTTLGNDTPVSRTSYEEESVEGGIKLKTTWSNTDKLFVGIAKLNNTGAALKPGAEGSGYVTATIKEITNNGKTATFEFTPDPDWTEGQELNVLFGSDTKTSIYNNKENVSININKLENRPNNKKNISYLDYYLGLFDYMSATTVYSQGNISDFRLEHRLSIIKFQIKGLDTGDLIKHLSIASTDNTTIFSVTAYLNNTEPRFTVAGPTSAIYETNSGYTEIAESDGTWYVYLILPPTKATEGKDITITAIDDKSETYTATLYGLPVLEAGKIYLTPEITMNKNAAQ